MLSNASQLRKPDKQVNLNLISGEGCGWEPLESKKAVGCGWELLESKKAVGCGQELLEHKTDVGCGQELLESKTMPKADSFNSYFDLLRESQNYRSDQICQVE